MNNVNETSSAWDLNPLLNPQSIALLGASENNFFSMMVLDNLRSQNYKGTVYPINPKYQELGGNKCYPSLEDLPSPPDTVIIMLKRELVKPMLERSIAAGAKSAIIITAGFGETGEPEWAKTQEEMKQLCIKHRFPVAGPNCLGIMSIELGAAMMAGQLRGGTIPGNVGMVMQSGGMMLGLTFPFYQRCVGMSYAISTGNNMVLDLADYLDYLIEDEKTQVICTFVEGIRKPERFIAAAKKALAAKKPLIILKTGSSERASRATMAHTGSMAGADRVLNEVVKKYGVVRVYDFDEMLETVALFSRAVKRPLPTKPGMCIITASGGACGLCSDLASSLGVTLPELAQETQDQLHAIMHPSAYVTNPVDATGQVLNTLPVYRKALEIIKEDPNIGVIVSFQTIGMPSNDSKTHQKQMFSSVELAKELDINLTLCSLGPHGLDEWQRQYLLDNPTLAFTQGAGKTIQAIDHLTWYSMFLINKAEEAQKPDPVIDSRNDRYIKAVEIIKGASGKALSEHESKKLLALYDIPVSVEKTAATVAGAVAAADAIGYPVVMKIDSPDILHKTEVGGIRIGLKDADAVRTAFGEIIASAVAARPDAKINGVLVQQMVQGGTEVIIGSNCDPQYGPCVLFGLGGIFVEIMKDTVLRLAPVTMKEAKEMISGIKAFPILNGARGRTKKDIDALAEIICRLSTLAYELKDYINELDINPVIVKDEGQGAYAVDALVVPK